ncbi:hypothetical protein PsYK624_132670 [Phanerochaete sordida]|uniref:Uncharacterized protein n=1 Tax=Phanerochaete sordida TaxID=48140 RepID=A0A9P3GK94_9APHY|nr:hypothetical protein PsYK624_132670 [Phanerochaete sordida]
MSCGGTKGNFSDNRASLRLAWKDDDWRGEFAGAKRQGSFENRVAGGNRCRGRGRRERGRVLPLSPRLPPLAGGGLRRGQGQKTPALGMSPRSMLRHLQPPRESSPCCVFALGEPFAARYTILGSSELSIA